MYDNTSGSSETVISSRVPSIKESTFRRPLIPQTYHKLDTTDAFKTQLDVSNITLNAIRERKTNCHKITVTYLKILLYICVTEI